LLADCLAQSGVTTSKPFASMTLPASASHVVAAPRVARSKRRADVIRHFCLNRNLACRTGETSNLRPRHPGNLDGGLHPPCACCAIDACCSILASDVAFGRR
jgi:hypothetical protein